MALRGLSEALVVGEEGAEVVADTERSGQVEGVEAAEGGWSQGRRHVEQCVVERQ